MPVMSIPFLVSGRLAAEAAAESHLCQGLMPAPDGGKVQFGEYNIL